MELTSQLSLGCANSTKLQVRQKQCFYSQAPGFAMYSCWQSSEIGSLTKGRGEAGRTLSCRPFWASLSCQLICSSNPFRLRLQINSTSTLDECSNYLLVVSISLPACRNTPTSLSSITIASGFLSWNLASARSRYSVASYL